MDTIEIKDMREFYTYLDMSAEAAEADDNKAYKEVMAKTQAFIDRMIAKYPGVNSRNDFEDAEENTWYEINTAA